MDCLRDWANDQLWPKGRAKVAPVDGFHCSWCKDMVSWRYQSGPSQIAGWVHRTAVDMPIATCTRLENDRVWNMRRIRRDADETAKAMAPPVRRGFHNSFVPVRTATGEQE